MRLGHGGISGLTETCQSGGAGNLCANWISSGENRACITEMIHQELGRARVQRPDPKQVDQRTPNGTIEATS